ncbi:MAG: hypothetical protein KAU95_01470, partial [Candidatus Aenigmarchaeota archaeon]|nr:hypothetical protein [Candidatus Aenigmarchaeota archaeon]
MKILKVLVVAVLGMVLVLQISSADQVDCGECGGWCGCTKPPTYYGSECQGDSACDCYTTYVAWCYDWTCGEGGNSVVCGCEESGSYCDCSDCGSASCGEWCYNYCSGSSVYHSRDCQDKGCLAGGCYDNPYTEEESVASCGDDHSCGSWNYYCSGNEVRRERTCQDKGCIAGGCYDNPYTEDESVEDCYYISYYCSGNELWYEEGYCSGGSCDYNDIFEENCCNAEISATDDDGGTGDNPSATNTCHGGESAECSGSSCDTTNNIDGTD